MDDVALLSLSAGNSYSGLGGQRLAATIWSGAVIAALFEEIYSVLLTNAVSPVESMKIFEKEWQGAITALEKSPGLRSMTEVLSEIAGRLRGIPVKRALADTPTVLLAGEIFVRHDDISRQNLLETLAGYGFASKVSTVLEWIYYTDWCFQKGLSSYRGTLKDHVSLFFRHAIMKQYEKAFRRALSRSDLCRDQLEDVDHILKNTTHLINPELTGEAILTVGTVLNEVVDHYCGAIAIGPFGCMPNRLAEAILNREMNVEGKMRTGKRDRNLIQLKDKIQDLPFLAIESDGNRFPQIITAKLEAFLLQAGRLQEELRRMNSTNN